MDLKQRLAFLPPQRDAAQVREAPAPTPVPSQSVEPSDERSRVIQGLREKMAAILERPITPPRPPADPEQTSLPFRREDTPAGPVYRRHWVLAPSHHVGRIPVDAARDSRPELLALLALDPAIAAQRMERALFLDTETTGLGGSGTLAFLVGLAWFDDLGRLNAEQLLLRSPAAEAALLELLRERLARTELLVSYNGKTFDWPLLKGRYVMNRLRAPGEYAHLDLLHIGRRLHRSRLGACRLVTLESEVLGFVRGPDIDGGEIASRYQHFLRTGDEEALRQVVEHNAWDVVSMAALVGLYGEPFDLMHGDDLVGFARTMKRAGALAVAERAADRALELGSHHALRVRGDVHKARGDRARALADFEAHAAQLDDAEVRLELAKLYEHYVRDPGRALAILERGTGETEDLASKRRARLSRKLARKSSPPASRGAR